MKTSELTGAALDWAVAKCEGYEYEVQNTYDGIGMLYEATNYSTNWSQGGPIIEREKIEIFQHEGDGWGAMSSNNFEFNCCDTPLVAAMRCYVASKLGDEVELPEEFK